MSFSEEMSSDPFPSEPYVVSSVVEGSGVNCGTLGVACIDLSNFRLDLAHFIDDNKYTKLEDILQVMQPQEVLVPGLKGDDRKSTLHVSDKWPTYQRERRFFNDTQGFIVVKRFAVDPSMVTIEGKDKKEMFSAAAALFEYLSETKEFKLPNHCLQVKITGAKDTMFLDRETIVGLELLNSSAGKSDWKSSLFGFLNKTRTRVGMRLLRSSILEPLMRLKDIQDRLDAVQDMIENKKLLDDVHCFLKEFVVDLSAATLRIAKNPKERNKAFLESQIDAVVFIRHAINMMPSLEEILKASKSNLLMDCLSVIRNPKLSRIKEEIKKYIDNTCDIRKGSLNYKNNKMFAVRADVDPYLQFQRQMYQEVLTDLYNLTDKISECHQLPKGTVKLVHSVNRGFHLEIPRNAFGGQDFPSVFIYQVKYGKNGQFVRCTCFDVIRLDNQISDIMERLLALSHGVIANLITFLWDEIMTIQNMSGALAQLDMISSLAVTSREHNLTRPHFSEDLIIKKGKHPIIMASLGEKGRTPVANDTRFSYGLNATLITGPNMSGKTIYIRQTALIQIMAQMGCFVPAEDMSYFPIVDQIFTRLGSDDDFETNCSTFMHEIRQLKYLLDKTTDKSLIIIDELGRGTSTEEGLALSVAVIESLIKRGSHVLFATHFNDLANLPSIYPAVSVSRMETKTKKQDNSVYIEFTHRLLPRLSDQEEEEYGINFAGMSGIQPQVVSDARAIISELQANKKPVLIPSSILLEKALMARFLVRLANSIWTDDWKFYNELQLNKLKYLEAIKKYN